MQTIIDAAFNRYRSVLMVLVLLLISGSVSYCTVSKESTPDITIPQIYISITHEGISPEDSDRMLVGPVEKFLRGLNGLKEIRSTASEGHASIILEFTIDTDIDTALQDVRDKVDQAKSELPNDADEPKVNEVNLALFPVLVVALSGDIDERILFNTAENLKDKIEALPEVLEAKIQGKREEVAEIIADPLLMESYNLSQDALFNLFQRNNMLVAAGTLDTGQGRFPIKVPGLIENEADILNLPIKAEEDRVVTFKDIAVGRRTYKDPISFARVNGRNAVTLEVSKRIGANIIETIAQIKEILDQEKTHFPKGLQINFLQDESKEISRSLNDLFNNVLLATLLVMVVIVVGLGMRSSGLVGLAIPGSFLTGILMLSTMGYTLNMVVLFGLILSVGMLVDGAIVVTEYADRKMSAGVDRFTAYLEAAQRMAWPIIASTATTLAVFMPLLFWPGIMGEFMKYLPITVMATLSASLLMALVVIPTLGSLVGKPSVHSQEALETLQAAESGDINNIPGITGHYARLLKKLTNHPKKLVLGVILFLVVSLVAFGKFGQGAEFFPSVEPDFGAVHIKARGDLALEERDILVREVESIVLKMPYFKSAYTTTVVKPPREAAPDVVGVIQLEFIDWNTRPKAETIYTEIRSKTRHIPGIEIEAKSRENGPKSGADIQLELSSRYPEALEQAVDKVVAMLNEVEGIRDISTNQALPGIEWEIDVDRAQASRFGADIAVVGSAIQMVTSGLTVGKYRPLDADDELDIRVRFPFNERNIGQLDRLRVSIKDQQVPISNFVKVSPVAKTGKVNRVNGQFSYKISADIEDDRLINQKLEELSVQANKMDIPSIISFKFRGNQEKEKESGQFLMKAFGIALFVMAIILVTQFNSFYQAMLILSAVICSTIGVFLVLLIVNEPFGIVMSGVGVIALAGIVVNNNIVLIDTYNQLINEGMEIIEAAVRTGAQRLRPVLLTTITTALGLLPMVLKMNLDLVHREITIGAPSSQWWSQLATAITGGLLFATVLTLVLTPCLLVIGSKRKERKEKRNIQLMAEHI